MGRRTFCASLCLAVDARRAPRTTHGLWAPHRWVPPSVFFSRRPFLFYRYLCGLGFSILGPWLPAYQLMQSWSLSSACATAAVATLRSKTFFISFAATCAGGGTTARAICVALMRLILWWLCWRASVRHVGILLLDEPGGGRNSKHARHLGAPKLCRVSVATAAIAIFGGQPIVLVSGHGDAMRADVRKDSALQEKGVRSGWTVAIDDVNAPNYTLGANGGQVNFCAALRCLAVRVASLALPVDANCMRR